jgi:hypothetical protein
MAEKFIESFSVDEWQVETDSGWDDIQGIGMTIPFQKWKIVLENDLFLECADDHILFILNDELNYQEVYTKDLNVGDYIFTKYGYKKIIEIEITDDYENMYDLQVSNNNRYFTNDILSHNSQLLGNLAVKAVENGLNCCIITLEMSEQIYIKRLAVNYLDIDIDEYDDITNDSARLQQIIESKKVSNGNGLKVPGIFRIKEFPTGSASSLDIENYINKIQDKYDMKFNLIIIDYLNIMKNWRNPNTENLYLKIKQIAEDVRALSQRLETCIVTATQLNRAGSSTSNIQMTDVSESMGIVQTVDALFAILNRDDFDISNGTIRLKQLAVRNVPPDETPETFNLNQKHLRIEEMNNLNKNIFNRSDSENESQNNELWNF